MADNKDAAASVAITVSSNFDKIPENVRNELLLKATYNIAENKDAAESVANALTFCFDKLPENVRTDLLFKLADNYERKRGLTILININSCTHLNRYLTISKLKRLVL